jgi:hypothetical protein
VIGQFLLPAALNLPTGGQLYYAESFQLGQKIKYRVVPSENRKGQNQQFTDVTLEVYEENIIGRTKLQQGRRKEF